jgi:hypothetical protein
MGRVRDIIENERGLISDTVATDGETSGTGLLSRILDVDDNDSGINATTVNGTPKELLGIGGEGYQWVDETDNREFGTEYTNTSGKPIQLNISFDDNSSDDDGSYDFYIDGTSVCNSSWASAVPRIAINPIIPNGSSYELSMTGTKNLRTWFELK